MAQVDMFLEVKTPELKGESKDKQKPGMVEIRQVVFSVRNEGTQAFGGGGGAGKAYFHDIQVVKKHLDKASPTIMLWCATGEHIPECKLYMRKAGGTQKDFYVWKFKNVFLSSYHLDTAHGEGVLPSDAFTINFGSIEMTYQEQNEKGDVGDPIVTGYDLKAQDKIGGDS